MMDVRLIRASALLQQIDYRDLIKAARSDLADPVDANVLELALCDESDSDCIDNALVKLFEKNGIEEMSVIDALNYYTASVCKSILDGTISPTLGSEKISRVAIANDSVGYLSLDPFIYASSEVESRPEDKKFFTDAIIIEAKNFLGKL